MTQATPYHVPKEPGRWRALALAAAVHAALLAFLWVGVRWQNDVPVAVEAEVWSPQIKEAAPVQQPEPEVKPQSVVKESPKPVVEQPIVKPDIALEQEKKRKEQKAREEEKLREEKLREQAREEQQKKLELAKKEASEKKLKDKAERQRLDKEFQDNLKRLQAQAGPGRTGDTTQSQGPRGNAEYVARVGAKIKSNTVFVVPDNLTGNPAVEYVFSLLPDGSIRRPIRKLKSSGVPGFDDAVLNAIEKSQPFPPDKTGKVPSEPLDIEHKPKDQ